MSVGLRKVLDGRTLEELIEKWEPIPLSDEALEELQVPPPGFVQFTLSLPHMPFEMLWPNPEHKKPATYFVSQMHKTWLTTKKVFSLLPKDGVFVDVGSYPFPAPIALRNYYKFKGRIVATVVQDLDETSTKILSDLSVELAGVDLDPHVTDGSISGFKCVIPLDDNSADVVLLSHVIEHLYHPMNILREIARVLKPGGSVIIATDNGASVNLLLNVIGGEDFVHEPVATTAAMQIHDWRGHVRFFTNSDLRTMLETAGLSDVQEGFAHFFFNSFSEEHYHDPKPKMSEWQLDLILKYPNYRNDLLTTATKPLEYKKPAITDATAILSRSDVEFNRIAIEGSRESQSALLLSVFALPAQLMDRDLVDARLFARREDMIEALKKTDAPRSIEALGASFQPSHSFDLVHLDTETRTSGVKDLLVEARRLVADEGIVVVGNYALYNHETAEPFGTVQAVNEAVANGDFSVLGLALHPNMFCSIALMPR